MRLSMPSYRRRIRREPHVLPTSLRRLVSALASPPSTNSTPTRPLRSHLVDESVQRSNRSLTCQQSDRERIPPLQISDAPDRLARYRRYERADVLLCQRLSHSPFLDFFFLDFISCQLGFFRLVLCTRYYYNWSFGVDHMTFALLHSGCGYFWHDKELQCPIRSMTDGKLGKALEGHEDY
jgi:hypothetical protein